MVVPLCRCRVLYVGSAVPTVTKDGLQGIQEPLRERYPVEDTADTKGIDSWLSVWSNGLLLEYIEGDKKSETAFFPIQSLHYCAAVRYVNVSGYSVEGGGERFLPLDSPFANLPDSPHPPIFAAIFRRTTGVKVLECHAFISTNAKAANALVRCCFHAYADSIYLKMDDGKIPGLKAIKEKDNSRSVTPQSDGGEPGNGFEDDQSDKEIIRWSDRAIGKQTWQRRQQSGDYDTASISSSLAGRYKKKEPRVTTAGSRTHSELGGAKGAVVPFTNGRDSRNMYRRSGSEADLREGYGPPLHMGMGPPMPGMPMGPPHMMGGPPMGPPMGPHMGPPPFGPPPHMMPPPGMFGPYGPPPPGPPFFGQPPPGMFRPFGPPPGPPFFGHPPPGMFGPFGPPPPGPPHSPDGGPIITGPESLYGTMPRSGRGGAFEEPIYMPGNMPMPPHPHMIPPQASYHPSSFPPDQYDAYYDSYKRHRSPRSKRKPPSTMSSSRRGAAERETDASNQFWDSYESGIYRKPHLNEKAFSTSIREERNGTLPRGQTEEIIRPETPPVDYDEAGTEARNGLSSRLNGVHVSEEHYRTRERMY